MVAERQSIGNEPLFRESMIEDPYPTYRRLREEARFHREPRTGALFLTHYADVAAALKHPHLSSTGVVEALIRVPAPLRGAAAPIQRMLSRGMLFSDPPDHTRLRALASRAFTPRAIEALRTRIEQIADELLDEIERREPADLVGGYAAVLPIRVIAEVLGASVGSRDRIKLWSDDLTGFGGGGPEPRWLVVLRAVWSTFCLRRYLRGLIRERRTRPGEDLLSALVAAEETGDSLTEEELIANALLLLVAGHETTASLIGNGLLALFRHPDQAGLLRRDPSGLPCAVEELLRFDGPVHRMARMAREDLEIGGCPIPAGQAVVLCPAAANRDPAQFPEPDRLDVHRAENRHVGFGHGIHFCLGAALARLEGQIAIGAVLRRFPDARLVDERPRWQPNISLRGLQALQVRLRG